MRAILNFPFLDKKFEIMEDPRKFYIDSFVNEGDFRVKIRFCDGKIQRIDFSKVCHHGDWKELEQLDYFNDVYLNEVGNLEWPHGQDFKPEHLYYWEKFQKYYCE